jgi:gamma-glutamyl-gamma-aminobutyraldehyde dehydrogenase
VLECGGKNPCIVLDDAEHLDVVSGIWAKTARRTRGSSREKIKDKLVETVLHKLREWPLGGPLHPGNRLGAIVSKEQFDRVMSYIKRGRAEGARWSRVAMPISTARATSSSRPSSTMSPPT